MTPFAWQDGAACHDGVSWVLFYGAEHERPAERDEREAKAKALCASCPVLDECRDHALGRPEKDGIWGGMSEAERESERRRRQRRQRAA
jgi:WhiB family redox-sensing transcriptional regulator